VKFNFGLKLSRTDVRLQCHSPIHTDLKFFKTNSKTFNFDINTYRLSTAV